MVDHDRRRREEDSWGGQRFIEDINRHTTERTSTNVQPTHLLGQDRVPILDNPQDGHVVPWPSHPPGQGTTAAG